MLSVFQKTRSPQVLLIASLIAFGSPGSAFAISWKKLCIQVLKKTVQAVGGENYPSTDTFMYEGTNYFRTTDPEKLPNGTLIDGSVGFGGMQPHYRVDTDRPEIQTLLKELESQKNESEADKIDWIVYRVRATFWDKSYLSKKSIRTNAAAIWNGKPVPLSSYVSNRAGVCRESAILTKILLDAAGIPNRIRYVRTWAILNGVKSAEDHQLNLVLAGSEWKIVDSYNAAFNGRYLKDAESPSGISVFKNLQTGIASTNDFPTFYIPKSPIPEQSFEVSWKNGKSQKFRIVGRTPAERTFAAEEERIERADPGERVPIEWLFMPAYGFTGHSALRVGNAIYEFTDKGWRIHGEGADHARAYLFNNPFMKRKAEEVAAEKSPAFSLGVPLSIRKSALVQWMADVETRKNDSLAFDFFTRNCNQSLLEGLRKTCPNFSGMKFDPFDLFSSVLTFKKLAKEAGLSQETIRVYPVNRNDAKISVRERLPEYVDPSFSKWEEAARVARELIVQKFSRLRENVVDEAIDSGLPAVP